MLQTQETIFDTCRYLLACSNIEEAGRDFSSESQIDKEAREKNVSPKEIRSDIGRYLSKNQLLVPEAVEQELKDNLLDSNKKLNAKNKSKLKEMLDLIKGRVIKISIGITEYNLQKQVFELIKKEAENEVRKITRGTEANIDGWENPKPQDWKNPLLRKIHKNIICKTWQKIKDFEDDVIKTANGLRKSPFLLNDFQIVLTGKKRKALIKTDDSDIKVLLAAYNQVTKENNIKSSHEGDIN